MQLTWTFIVSASLGATRVLGAENSPVNLTQLSPSNFPTIGGTVLTVAWSESAELHGHVGSSDGVKTNITLCRITSTVGHPSFSHAGYGAVSVHLFSATPVNDTAAVCTAPTVLAPGTGTLDVSFDNGTQWTNALPMAYFTLIDAVVARRPYLNETEGQILLSTNPSFRGQTLTVTVTLLLSSGNVTLWGPASVEVQNDTSTLQFSLDPLVPVSVNTDVVVTVLGQNNPQVTIRRRFQRIPLSGLPTGATPSVVDHTTRSLVVGGKPFLGMGWYLNAGRAGNATELFGGLATHGQLGTNQLMPYELVALDPQEQLSFLDHCHASGIRVLFPMQQFGVTGGITVNYSKHWDGSADARAWQAQVVANVTLVKHHPALLGYYICDDCCPTQSNLEDVALMARLYNLIKAADPYHIVSGAVQCPSMWMWSDVPSYLPASADQPVLQLSLDYPLWENYGNGVLANRVSDSAIARRNGVEFEPVVNCVGLWWTPTFMDHPSAAKITRSAMWLGIIASAVPNQLVFLLQNTGFTSSVTEPDGGWLQTIQPAIWGAQVRALMPSVLPRHGEVFRPTADVLEAAPLVPTSVGPPGLNGPLVSVGAWAEACPTVCAHVIVVNLHQQSFVHFTIRLTGLTHVALPTNATRLFDATYNSTVDTNGLLTDFIGPGDTNVYEIGCTGPKPNSSVPEWLPCANRRVVCKKGFVNTDPNNATCSYW